MAAAPQIVETRAAFSPKAAFLFEPHRYKVMYGGRYGIKSWSMARALLIRGAQQPIRWLCARETMESIAQSVHQLLKDQIEALHLEGEYEVQKAAIVGRNGTIFTFAGLAHNVGSIKSLESYDGVWVEEAQNVSKDSWETLIPTIRKQGSEIWVSFNPNLATDDTYQRFVLNPPPGAVVVMTSWRDNQWLTPTMREEIEYLQKWDPKAFEHVYEGATRSTVANAIYADEIGRAEKEQRFTIVPYEPKKPVDTYWDLGYGDMVSIWFAQAIGFQYRVCDYYENTQKAIDHYIQVIQARGYVLGLCVLPWDGGTPALGTGRSIREMMQAKGLRVRVLPQLKVDQRINAARTVFHQCWFDALKCADGISGLRRYQWGPTPANGVMKREPLHDAASHPADAFGYMALHIKTPETATKTTGPAPRRPDQNGRGWMV